MGPVIPCQTTLSKSPNFPAGYSRQRPSDVAHCGQCQYNAGVFRNAPYVNPRFLQPQLQVS